MEISASQVQRDSFEQEDNGPVKAHLKPEIYMNLNATKCTFGHSDNTSGKRQKSEKS